MSKLKTVTELLNENRKGKLNEGRGNASIRFEGVNYPTYYIEYYEPDEDEPDNDQNEYFLDDVIGNFKGIKGLNYLDKVEYLSNEQFIRFENDIVRLVFEDNEWSMALGFIPVYSWDDEKDEESYNEEIFKEEANRLMKEINGMYNLKGRASAWTSSEIPRDYTDFY